MSKKCCSDCDEYPEITESELARASFRIGELTVSREEWLSSVKSHKKRIHIMLDDSTIAWFKAQAGARGYQRLINDALKNIIHDTQKRNEHKQAA